MSCRRPIVSAVPAKATETSVVFFNDPKAALTIATKIQFASGDESASKVRDVPHDERARQDKPDSNKKKKIMIGCEPSFSPVTTPSMAHCHRPLPGAGAGDEICGACPLADGLSSNERAGSLIRLFFRK